MEDDHMETARRKAQVFKKLERGKAVLLQP